MEYISIIKEPQLIGRAKYNILENTLSSYPIKHPKIDSACHLLYYPSVNPDGGVITCCTIANVIIQEGSPLYLGNINEELLDDILERAKRNTFLEILTRKGPVELKRILESTGQNFFNRKVYHSQCELCCELLGNLKLLSILEREVKQARQIYKEI